MTLTNHQVYHPLLRALEGCTSTANICNLVYIRTKLMFQNIHHPPSTLHAGDQIRYVNPVTALSTCIVSTNTAPYRILWTCALNAGYIHVYLWTRSSLSSVYISTLSKVPALYPLQSLMAINRRSVGDPLEETSASVWRANGCRYQV
jgi:hypothetical protein